jgi:hypothetical protein
MSDETHGGIETPKFLRLRLLRTIRNEAKNVSMSLAAKFELNFCSNVLQYFFHCNGHGLSLAAKYARREFPILFHYGSDSFTVS